MGTREAACSCGQLRLWAEGDPVRVSICHCLACQRRTGSVFGAQARFPADRVRIEGRHTDYTRSSDEDPDRKATFSFCPDCGAIVFYTSTGMPDADRGAGRRVRRSELPAAQGLRVGVAPPLVGAAPAPASSTTTEEAAA